MASRTARLNPGPLGGAEIMTRGDDEVEYRARIFPNLPFGINETPETAAQWNQILFLFGQAALHAQAYEDGLARLIVAAEQRWKRSGKSAEQINRLTLGQLQQEFRRYSIPEGRDEDFAEELRNARNSISHSFYRRRAVELATTIGRDQVIAELNDFTRVFQAARDEMYWLLSALTGCELL